jgi:hypothetical protein
MECLWNSIDMNFLSVFSGKCNNIFLVTTLTEIRLQKYPDSVKFCGI